MNEKELTPEAVDAEILSWHKYLNEVVGVLCFTLGLACLGTKSPATFGFISMIFVVTFHLNNREYQPTISNFLTRKNNRSEFEEYVLKDIRQRISRKNSLSLGFGYSFLSIIAGGKLLLSWCQPAIILIYGSA